MDKIVEVKNLTKIYGQGTEDLCVLDDVSFDVKKGEFMVLLGPSGTGKSTLLNLIAMLDEPTKGEIILDGKKLSKMSENAKSKIRLNKIGFVFQFDSLMTEFSMVENVDMPALMAGHPSKKKAKELLKGFGLDAIADKMPSLLSGGEKQRASIARALRNNPSVILADEPTGNLDGDRKIAVFKDFQRLAKEGKTIIMVTHDVHATEFADKVYSLENAKLKEVK
ncbi:putative ABC transport system ATP-binding protein/lipoprotein-releasing system ATP-binding protein [Parelusimicrobium proximum]|uniref:ABC transporter ATP-binding protein n=1 Tax=Parelusimicrobium proximum TaxID=3228953 RepID=UPI003D17C75B